MEFLFGLFMHILFFLGVVLVGASIIRIIILTYYTDAPRNTPRYKVLVAVLIVSILSMVLIWIVRGIFSP